MQTDFYERVYNVVLTIPEGRVTTYGAIANFLGRKSSARIVGYAMNMAHTKDKFIPAHRVVNRLGLLTGRHHFNPPELMQTLLEQEGIIVQNSQVQHFEQVFWQPK